MTFLQLATSTRPYGGQNLVERFSAMVPDRPVDGCWVWDGKLTHRGYGLFRLGRRMIHAHRISWWLATGEEPGELEVAHHCDNPPCVRPDHLFLATHRENMQDAVAKGRMKTGGRASAESRRRHLWDRMLENWVAVGDGHSESPAAVLQDTIPHDGSPR